MTKQKIDKGDEVLVRGEAVLLEDNGYIRQR
ncbi:hypothetical protein J2Z50_001520 [Ensifer mexicanus]|nr:hypothetical protein [Sinorhizobium mexicanum]